MTTDTQTRTLTFTIRRSVLRDHVKAVAVAALDKQKARPVLSGILFEVERVGSEGFGLTLTATDSYRLASAGPLHIDSPDGYWNANEQGISVILPADEVLAAFKGMRHYDSSDVTISLSENEANIGPARIQTTYGDFPNYRQLFPELADNVLDLPYPGKLANGLRSAAKIMRAYSTVKREEALINEGFTAKGNARELLIAAATRGYDKAPAIFTLSPGEPVSVKVGPADRPVTFTPPGTYKGKAMEFGVKPEFFAEAIESVSKDGSPVEVHIADPLKPIQIIGGPLVIRHLLMPVRLPGN